MNNDAESSKVKWHEIFAAVQQELLSMVNISVQPEFPITSQPPRGDILILQPNAQTGWTTEQRDYLPDGVRDSLGQHHLLELKYTQSVNREVVEQVISYDYLYRDSRNLKREQVRSFILSSRTTQEATRQALGYTTMSHPGVYHSHALLLEDIPLILLNELRDESHNVFFKLFGSQQQAKLAAFNGLGVWWSQLSERLQWLINGLFKQWLKKGDAPMNVITSETLIEEGKEFWQEWFFDALSKEQLAEIIAHSPTAQQILAEREAEIRAAEQAEALAQLAEREAEIRAAERAEGRAEGRAEAHHQALLQQITQILVVQLQADGDTWQARLAPLSNEQLEQLSKTALLVSTMAAFEAEFAKIAAQE